MNKEKVHIDKYFKEKVKTQKVEGSIPSFDAFLSSTRVETSVVTNTVVTTGVSKSLLFLILAVVIVVGGLFYVNLENIDPKVPVLNEQSLDVESIKTVKNENIEEVVIEQEHVDVKDVSQEKKVKEVSEKTIKTKKTPLVEAEDVLDTLILKRPESIIASEEVIDSIEIKEETPVLEALKEPEPIKETAKGLDLFMKKHLDEDEKGVDLYKEK